jgi:putative ABC transport system permease protein
MIQSAIRSDENRLTIKDVNALKEKCSLIYGLAPQISRQVTARYLANNLSTSLIGTSSDFLRVRNFSINKGRFFNEEEMNKRETVCILGSSIAKTLFGEYTSPIGRTIKVNSANNSGAGIRLTVIGIFKEKGTTFGNDNDKLIVAPLNTVQYRLFDEKFISVIYVEAASASAIKDAKIEIYRALLPLHNNKSQNIDVRGQDEIIKSVEQTMGAFTFMLSGIALVSLLVGGIGIMNIMIVSVTERTREIGLRKALGARKNDILFQFLVEALVLGITGGIIGICSGLILAKLYTVITATSSLKMLSKTFISFNSILLSFSFSALVGIFFGLYPAKKAASLDPIDALRYE